jgi:DNA-binding NarL/FixJ family response regulator
MLDVETCKILIVGNCIFTRGVASIVRDVVPSASIVEAFCFADASARLNRSEFFAAIFDIDASELGGPISFRTLRVDFPYLILGVLSRTAIASDILSYLAAGVTGYILEGSGQTEVERAVRGPSMGRSISRQMQLSLQPAGQSLRYLHCAEKGAV